MIIDNIITKKIYWLPTGKTIDTPSSMVIPVFDQLRSINGIYINFCNVKN